MPKHTHSPLSHLSELLCNLVFPPRCVACHTPGTWLCLSCIRQIEFLQPMGEEIAQFPELQGVHSVARLSGPLRQAIHFFKYEGLRTLASTLGELLCDGWEAARWPVQVVVPVPLHFRRLRERGYNQSALLARELGRGAALPVQERTLVRIAPTRPQVGLSAKERAENVRDAFRCRDKQFDGMRVLLVDDVLTTGATLRACARALLEGNARAVWALTLTRAAGVAGDTT